MKIIIDERESALFHACKSDQIQISKEVLPLGDIIIASDSGSPVVLFERKTLSDLLSSIKDGRYEEQSYRLQHSLTIRPHNIVYIIEGMYSQLSKPADKKIVLSAVTSLLLFKGFSVLRTASVQDTAELIVYMADKIHRNLAQGKQLFASVDDKDETKKEESKEVEPYCTVVKTVKKDNLTPENMGEVILCQIPGIRSVTAIAIMKQTGSILNLIKTLQESPQTIETMVIGGRKISKTVVANLKRFLLFTMDKVESDESKNAEEAI
jgi:ERCC4-type nuclease